MGTMMKVFAGILVVAAGVYFATRTPSVESTRMAEAEPSAADAEIVDVELSSQAPDSVADAGGRSPVADESPVGEAAALRTKILRVTFEGVTVEYAQQATVTVTGVKESNGRRTRIQDSWPCEGLTSEFDLDPFLERLAQRAGELSNDELIVVVDHPLHFSESTVVALSSGVELESGQLKLGANCRFCYPTFTRRRDLDCAVAAYRAWCQKHILVQTYIL